jgi:thiol:disulfide interchange protein DsbA
MKVDKEEAIVDFVEKQGVDRKKFLEIYNSFTVQAKVARVAQLQVAYNIESVPTVAIDGRFITSPSMVGATMRGASEHAMHAAALQTMDALIARKK